MKMSKDSGFTVVESLIVTSLLGLLSLVSLPALNKTWHEYRLTGSSREIMANIQLAKLKSVSNNFGYSFRFTSSGSNTYQVSGSETVGPDGAFHSWNDANGNGIQDDDNSYSTSQRLKYASFSTTGVSALPNGSFVGSIPSTIIMTFRPDGRLNTSLLATNYRCVVLQDGVSRAQSVCAESGGLVRLYRYTNNTWVETK